jgi:hypothetical protein
MIAQFDARRMLDLYKDIEKHIAMESILLPVDPMGNIIPCEDSPLMENISRWKKHLAFVRSFVNQML